jgi:hypothetical protein
VIFGKPVDMQELREQKGTAEEVNELIMNSIGQLIEKYK